MPFATSPVLVGIGDQVEVRYPTPSTWNTQTTVQVQIGTGNDPDGITFGTRIPDATPENFSFTDQVGYLNPNGTSVQSTFERVSTYYSNEILVTGIEIAVPARIEASVSGPKISESNPAAITTLNAAFRINRGGVIGPWITSGDVQEGDLIRLRIQTVDWYTQTHNVTLFVSDETWGTDVGNPPATRSDTWSITTRAQDQLVNNPLFVDFVDAKSATFGGYRTQSVSLAAVDNDVVLRALASGDCEVSSDNVNWSTLVTGLTSVDTLFTRIAIGSDYTTKTTGDITIFAVGGDTIGGGFPTGPENNVAGTYGSGAFTVVQTAGTITDDWQVWTEVDRYPDTAPIVIGPIFKPSLDSYTQDPSVITKNTLTGTTIFSSTTISGQANQSYTVGVTGSTSSINGEDATFLIARNGVGEILPAGVTIISGGRNYTVGEQITLLGSFIGGSNGPDNLILTVSSIQDLIYWNVSSPFYNNQEYGQVDNVIVANSYGYYDADPGQYYYSNFDISGLGTEYVDGIYSDLEAPFASSSGITAGQLPLDTSLVNGGTVQILAQVASGDAEIRKNNTGNWVQQLFVQNGDQVNVRMISPLTFDDEKSSTFVFNELQGGPNPNPTQGPTSPSEPFVNRTFILRTRKARTSPIQTRITDVWEADAGQTYVEAVNLSGLDEDTIATAETGLSSPAVNVQVSIDNLNFSTSVFVPKNTPTLYVRATASTTQGFTREAVYSVGFAPNKMFDTWKLTTKFTNYIYYTLSGANYGTFVNYSIPDYIDQLGFIISGAGGGKGGDEEPSSEGGRGGNGALVRGTVAISPAVQGDFTLRNLRLYSPERGTDGKGNDSYGAGFTGITAVSLSSSTAIPAQAGQTYGPVTGVPIISTVATNSQYTVIRGTGGSIQSVEPFFSPGEPGTGSRYLIGDQVRISFDQVGGTTSADDIIVTVTDTAAENDAGTAGVGGWGYATGGDGGNAGPDDRSGGGGGGGGAAALLFGDGTPIVIAGGGGGGGGAGNDTKLPEGDQEGNRTLAPTLRTDITGINLVGLAGQTPTDVGSRVGGGGGGGGGGWGTGGLIGTSLEYNSPLETASVVRTEDLDAQGGTSGDVYYDSSIVTLSDPTEVSDGPSPGDNGVIVLYYPPQDLTPLPFSFTQIDDVDIFTQVESSLAQILDITGNVSVSVSNGQVRTFPPGVTDPAQASAWSNGGTVRNTGYVQVRLITGASYNNLYTSVVTVGTESSTFSVTTGSPPDTDPTGYILAAVNNVDISTPIESNTVTVSGINRTVQINAFGDGSPGNPQILVCPLGDCTGQSYQSGPVDINNGDSFTIRKTSSPDYSTPVNVTVQVGTQSPSNIWTITTRAEPDATPVGFIFTNVFGADLNTEITSVTRIIQGISDPINITVTGGASILRNGVERTDPVANVAVATFDNLDEIALIYTTSSIIGDTVTFTITAGTYTTQWIVGNSGVFGTTPDPLPVFATVLANNPGELTSSAQITLDTNNGLSGPVGISATSGD